MLTAECSAIIKQKLPPKLKDLGSFVIPCEIRNIMVSKALCDLGASINLMSLSIFKRLGWRSEAYYDNPPIGGPFSDLSIWSSGGRLSKGG